MTKFWTFLVNVNAIS